jgi:hypothetical protein
VVGEMYEVAMIHEDPGYVMIKSPGSDAWPKPGDPGFAYSFDLFERPSTPWEIATCGYDNVTYLCEQFGIMTTDPAEVAIVAAAKREFETLSDYPEEKESFSDWQKRCAAGVAEALAQWIYDVCSSGINPPDISVFDDIVWPAELRGSLAAVGYYLEHIVYWNLRASEVAPILTRFAKVIGIREVVPQRLDEWFWVPSRMPWQEPGREG